MSTKILHISYVEMHQLFYTIIQSVRMFPLDWWRLKIYVSPFGEVYVIYVYKKKIAFKQTC